MGKKNYSQIFPDRIEFMISNLIVIFVITTITAFFVNNKSLNMITGF